MSIVKGVVRDISLGAGNGLNIYVKDESLYSDDPGIQMIGKVSLMTNVPASFKYDEGTKPPYRIVEADIFDLQPIVDPIPGSVRWIAYPHFGEEDKRLQAAIIPRNDPTEVYGATDDPRVYHLIEMGAIRQADIATVSVDDTQTIYAITVSMPYRETV